MIPAWFSPAVVDRVGMVILLTVTVLFVLRVVLPPKFQDRLRDRFNGPVNWFHRHII